MPRRRIGRFVLEAVFLAAVAAVAAVSDLRPAGVIVLMALAWIVVALFEWAAWLDEPHYGRGLPPRFYVPQVALPPPRPVEQHRPGRPAVREADDAPTFAVSPGEWATAFDEWPVLASPSVGAETAIAVPEEPLAEFPPEIEYLVVEPAAHPEAEVAEEHPRAALEPQPTPAPSAIEQAAALELPEVAVAATARHRVDPLAPARRSRLRLRPGDEAGATIEVRDRPPADRALPSRPRGEGASAGR